LSFGAPVTAQFVIEAHALRHSWHRYVVFNSMRGGFPSIWRMDLEGGNLKQLSDGQEDYVNEISPDGRWIIFDSWRSGRTPWKLSIDGGQPAQIVDKFTYWTATSPDGKRSLRSIMKRRVRHIES
jgi:Tol biopolymer transport system component